MLHTLGGLHLEGAARQQSGPLVLLSYLALEGPQERRSVQELFFPGHLEAAGRLRMLLHRLKQAAPEALDTPGTRLLTPLPSDAGLLFQAAESQDAAQVLALYQGRFLEGVRLPGDQELEEWVFSTRERLAARVRSSQLTLGRAAALRRETGQALGYAERAYLLPGAPEPDRDEACLMALLLTATGSAFAADARTETRQLGVTLPEHAGEALAQLGAGSPPDALPTGVERRRRTDAVPWEERTGPTVPAAPEPTAPEATLPALMGREDALAHLDDSFESGARLVTLLGSGGIGKTLLARHALQRAVQRHHRAASGLLPGVLVDLSAVHDPAGVLPAIAGTVQARSASLPDVVQAVRGYELLVLDNFEQVLPAARDVAALLEALPGLRMLITSRERLHLAQEYVLPIDGLSLTVPQDMASGAAWSDAARLFVRRAARAHLGFVPEDHRAGIEEVCTLLRGVPLLIELASAWVRTLTPAEIVWQLDGGRLRGADLTAPDLDLLETRDQNVPARHASARTVLQTSWNRLKPAEQGQLAQLAVFLSDFTVKAARQVTGATLSTLANLIDKSWLGTGAAGLGSSGRLRWHPLARAFVREVSAGWPEGGWQSVLHPHALYFAQGLDSSRFLDEGLSDLLGEWPDIGQATRTLARYPEDWPLLTRLAREVPKWADQVGNYASVAGLIGRVLDTLPPGAAPSGHLLRARAAMRVRMHQLQAASEDYRRAADLLIQSGDALELLQGLDVLAVLHHQEGAYDQAEAVWRDILRRVEPLGLLAKQAYTLQYLGVNAWMAGQLSEAERWIREAIRAEERLPLRPNRVLAQSTLGRTLTRLGRRAEAHAALSGGLKLAQELQAVNLIPELLNYLSLNLLELQRPQEAVQLCLDALARKQTVQPGWRAEIYDTLALCYAHNGEPLQAREALAASVRLDAQLQDAQVLLHRLCTYAFVQRPVMTPEDQAALLHWLLGRASTDAALRELVLRTLREEVQPSLLLPALDPAVFSPEAQRLCGYVPGELTLPTVYSPGLPHPKA